MFTKKISKTNYGFIMILAFALVQTGCMKGPRGASGAPGASGVTTQNQAGIVSTMNCGGKIYNSAYAELNGLEVAYDAVLTTKGDVYSTASVSDSYKQTSGTSFYAAGQQGSQSGSVYLTYDVIGSANGGYWKISLNRDTLVTTAIYKDSSVGQDIPITFDKSACEVRSF